MYRVRILSDRVILYKHKYNNLSDNTIVPCAGFLEENNLKRFYFTCPKCLKTVMSGTDIYEKRALDCSCGNKINVDLNELVLKECDSCGKNNAFMKNKGKEQSCLACGKMLKLSLPEDILSGDDRAVFEQIKEILGKGLMTKVKIEKADSLFKTISAKGDFAGYANHINNYKEFNMYDSEYNSAVRIMNESSKKLEDAAEYNSKEEYEKRLSDFSKINLPMKKFLKENILSRHIIISPIINVSLFHPRWKKLTMVVTQISIMSLMISVLSWITVNR